MPALDDENAVVPPRRGFDDRRGARADKLSVLPQPNVRELVATRKQANRDVPVREPGEGPMETVGRRGYKRVNAARNHRHGYRRAQRPAADAVDGSDSEPVSSRLQGAGVKIELIGPGRVGAERLPVQKEGDRTDPGPAARRARAQRRQPLKLLARAEIEDAERLRGERRRRGRYRC